MKAFDVGVEANGFVAIGQFATGVIAIGQVATGFVAVGQLARGVIVVGQLALGLAGIGQLILAPLRTLGQLTLAWDAHGLVAVPLRLRATDSGRGRAAKLLALAGILAAFGWFVAPPLVDVVAPPPAICTGLC